jgi:hypothetical protein
LDQGTLAVDLGQSASDPIQRQLARKINDLIAAQSSCKKYFRGRITLAVKQEAETMAYLILGLTGKAGHAVGHMADTSDEVSEIVTRMARCYIGMSRGSTPDALDPYYDELSRVRINS